MNNSSSNLLDIIVDHVETKLMPKILEQLISKIDVIQDRTLDVIEASEHIGISKELLYRMCAAKQIPHVRIGVEGTRKPKLLFSTRTLTIWKREQEQLNYLMPSKNHIQEGEPK